jgi:hypothetical protein
MAESITIGWIGLTYEEGEGESGDVMLSLASLFAPEGIIEVQVSWEALFIPQITESSSSSSLHVYLRGSTQAVSFAHSFLAGKTNAKTSAHAYIPYLIRNSKPAYIFGLGGSRTKQSAYTFGYEQPSAISITLINSDETFFRYFRVLADGYDDGTLNRTEKLEHLIDGRLSHNYGSIYRTWSALIKVRETETEYNYGSIADLLYFYKLINPTTTPSTTITLIDHHSATHYINLLSNLGIQLLSCSIVGTTAWFIYRVTFEEVTP